MNATFIDALALTSSAEFKSTKRMLEFHSDGDPDELSATTLVLTRCGGVCCAHMIGGSDSGRGRTRNGTRGTTLSLSQQQILVPAIEAGVSGFHCFISYRRTGVATARNVKQSMEKVGYSCFMDFEDLNVGDFQAQLEKNLAGTPVVIVILTPGSLTTDARWDGGGRPGETDWLQQEVQLALQMKKLIVPVAR